MLELPIEPPEPKIRAETRCQICGDPVEDYSKWNIDSYFYIISGFRMCRGCVENWLKERRVALYD